MTDFETPADAGSERAENEHDIAFSRELARLKADPASEIARLYPGWTTALTPDEMKADLAFLVLRAEEATSCNYFGLRWIGASSDAIVAVAFGADAEKKCLPLDESDLAACYLSVLRLPAHRRIPAVRSLLARGEAYVASRRSYDVRKVQERIGWPGSDAIDWVS